MKLLIEEYGKLIIIIIVIAALIGLVAIFKLKGYSLADTSLGSFVGVSENAIQDTDTSRTTYSAKIPSSTSSTINSSGGNAAKVKAGDKITIDAGYINSAKTIEVASLAEQTPGTAVAGDILAGKTVWVNGVQVTGTLPNQGTLTNDKVASGTIPAGYYTGDSLTRKGAQTYMPGTSNQTIAAGQFLTGTQTIKGDANLVAANIAVGKTIFGVTGTYGSGTTASASDVLQGKTVYINGEKITGTLNPTTFTSGATATADKILAGYTAYANGTKITGTISSQSATTVTPGTINQTITKGKYLSGDITVKGDVNLKPENIKTGVSIFSVNGTFTSDATATADKILEGYTAYVKGQKVTGTASLAKFTQDGTAAPKDILAGKTAYVKGQRITGTLVVKDLTTDATATAADIRKGKTAYTPNGKVTGTMDVTSETPGTAVAIDIYPGKTAWVNGLKITGAMRVNKNYTYYQVKGADNEGLTFSSSYALGNNTTVKLGIGDAAQFQPGFYDNGFKVENTVINRGDKSANLNCGQSVTLAAGYYTGGTIKANSLASQTQANATAAQILSTYTAWVNGTKITGSMPNRGNLTKSLNCGQSVDIPAGYYSGGKITANSLASQTGATATADKILKGYTAWVNGSKVTGTIPEQTDSRGYRYASSVGTNVWGDPNANVYFRIPAGSYLNATSVGVPEIYASKKQVIRDAYGWHFAENATRVGWAANSSWPDGGYGHVHFPEGYYGGNDGVTNYSDWAPEIRLTKDQIKELARLSGITFDLSMLRYNHHVHSTTTKNAYVQTRSADITYDGPADDYTPGASGGCYDVVYVPAVTGGVGYGSESWGDGSWTNWQYCTNCGIRLGWSGWVWDGDRGAGDMDGHEEYHDYTGSSHTCQEAYYAVKLTCGYYRGQVVSVSIGN